MFPTVFNTKIPKKIHRIVFIVLSVNLNFTRLPFIDKIQAKNKFIRIEIVSKTYISLSFESLPPQAILYGINFMIIQM